MRGSLAVSISSQIGKVGLDRITSWRYCSKQCAPISYSRVRFFLIVIVFILGELLSIAPAVIFSVHIAIVYHARFVVNKKKSARDDPPHADRTR